MPERTYPVKSIISKFVTFPILTSALVAALLIFAATRPAVSQSCTLACSEDQAAGQAACMADNAVCRGACNDAYTSCVNSCNGDSGCISSCNTQNSQCTSDCATFESACAAAVGVDYLCCLDQCLGGTLCQ